jgi:chemotaxis methyl-accepting protein methylase
MSAAPQFVAPAAMLPPITVDGEDFEYFRQKISELAGISLSSAKKELLQSRLRSRIHAAGMKTFKAYRQHLESIPSDHPEWQEFINLLTTNKTDWFREPAHFEFIVNEFLPRWKKKNKQKLSVWSSASSTGEEPYTLSIVLDHALKDTGIDYEILATDLDTQVLARAKNGVYRRSQLEQVPEIFRKSSFAFGTGEISDWMKVRPGLKRPIRFEQFNLMTETYPWPDQFDLVLCRNVLIYFPKHIVGQVAKKMYDVTVPGGALLIGHSESIQNLDHAWKPIRPSVLIKGDLG